MFSLLYLKIFLNLIKNIYLSMKKTIKAIKKTHKNIKNKPLKEDLAALIIRKAI